MLRGIIVCAWAFATLASAAWAQDWPTESNADFDALLEAARAEGEIVIMGSLLFRKNLRRPFEADTGIKASFIPRGRGAERQRFYREVEADRLTIDVFLSGPTPFSLVEKDQLAPVRDIAVAAGSFLRPRLGVAAR